MCLCFWFEFNWWTGFGTAGEVRRSQQDVYGLTLPGGEGERRGGQVTVQQSTRAEPGPGAHSPGRDGRRGQGPEKDGDGAREGPLNCSIVSPVRHVQGYRQGSYILEAPDALVLLQHGIKRDTL